MLNKIKKNVEISLDCPWKLKNELLMLVQTPLVLAQFFLQNIHIGKNAKFYGLPVIQKHRQSKIIIGKQSEFRSSKSSNPLSPFHPVVISTRSKNSIIKIGEKFAITGGSVVANKKIVIGNGVLVGANCLITDTDFHPIDASLRKKMINTNKSKPVMIGNNCFIGTRAIILKGTILGKNCVVGAGAVVSGKFPDGSIIVGNPAKILRLK